MVVANAPATVPAPMLVHPPVSPPQGSPNGNAQWPPAAPDFYKCPAPKAFVLSGLKEVQKFFTNCQEAVPDPVTAIRDFVRLPEEYKTFPAATTSSLRFSRAQCDGTTVYQACVTQDGIEYCGRRKLPKPDDNFDTLLEEGQKVENSRNPGGPIWGPIGSLFSVLFRPRK